MRDLPPGWVWTTLGEIAEIGPRQDRSVLAASTLVSFVPMARVEAGTGVLDPSETREWRQVSTGYVPFSEGDVLFARITPCMENGKVALACNLTNGLGAGSTEFHVVRAQESVEPLFLLHYLLQTSIRRDARAVMQGAAGQLRVPATFLKTLAIALPPTAEQRRIVAEIERLFSCLDSAMHNLGGLVSKANLYKYSYLKTIYGSASPYSFESSGCDSSTALAEVVRKRHSLARGTRSAEPVPPGAVDDLTVPRGWTVASIDQICSQVTDGEHIQPPYQESGFPMLSATHVRNDAVNFERAGLISAGAFATARARCAPEPGDILVVSVGATTGRAGKVNTSVPFALVRSVLLLKPLVNPDFLLRWLQSLHAQRWISRASGSTAQPHLYIRDIKRMPVPFAPPYVQGRVAAAVETCLSDFTMLVSTAETALSRAARLRQAILKKAFEGKLVPQDPNDEPASVLLQRISRSRPERRRRDLS